MHVTVHMHPNCPPVNHVLPYPFTHLFFNPLSSLFMLSFFSPSLFLFTSGDGDQLLGSLGNVVGALDDLLSEELVVHCRGPWLRWGCLTALHLQPGGTGGQQAQGAVDCIQCWPLQTKEGDERQDGS